MDTDFTVDDQIYLKQLDAAFDEKSKYQGWLLDQNHTLSDAAKRWCKQAQEQSKRADQAEVALDWWRLAAITVSALLLITIVAVLKG